MYCAELKAVLLEPVAIKRHRQSDRSETVRYIPGTVLRGALAAAYLRRGGGVDDQFQALFTRGECRFGPLDPARNLAPLTAMACKRGGVAHALWDSLWERMTAALRSFPIDESGRNPWKCPECESDMKPLDGYFYDSVEQGGEADKRVIEVGFMHVGIDRLRGSAAEGILYSVEALAPVQLDNEPVLYGCVRATAPEWIRALAELTEEEIYVGHHKTRGYGRCRLVVDNAEGAQAEEQNPQEWEQWSKEFIAYARQVDSALELDPDRDFFFTINLPYGAVVVDPFLRYSLDPADVVDWLPPLPDPAQPDYSARPEKPFEDGKLRCVAARTRHELVRGWNAAHGLPRADEYAIDRGAVYAYQYTGGQAGRQALHARLASLVEDGLGLRLSEGFGRVVVCDGFHRVRSSADGGRS